MRNDLQLTPWSVSCQGNSWADDFYESIFFLGNGRMGVRGYVSAEPDARPVQKGVYLAGMFGEIKPGITDFVNLPTPVWDRIEIDGGEAILSSPIRRRLDMKQASLTMDFCLRSGKKSLKVEYQRFLPKEQPALILQRLRLIPDQAMEIRLTSGIFSDSCNSPIPDDQTKSSAETIQLSNLLSAAASQEGICCDYQILGTDLTVSQKVQFRTPDFRYIQSNGSFSTFAASAEAG